jgi:hypothetical protein
MSWSLFVSSSVVDLAHHGGHDGGEHLPVVQHLARDAAIAFHPVDEGVKRFWVKHMLEVVQVVRARLLTEFIILGQILDHLIEQQAILGFPVRPEPIVDRADDLGEW